MVSKRIKIIASLLDKSDKVLDVGTDHALLPIYLYKKDLVELVDASDISSNVLLGAKSNIEKYNLSNKISLYLSDGLKNIDIKKYNTLVICGMGFFTIKSILDADLSPINKLIIQTNNHLSDFRKYIASKNFMIRKEVYIFDQGIDYIIFDIKKGHQVLSDDEIQCGIYNRDNIDYYKKQIDNISLILENIPHENQKKREELKLLINIYKKYLSREKTEEK